jgi:hypothetical protein
MDATPPRNSLTFWLRIPPRCCLIPAQISEIGRAYFCGFPAGLCYLLLRMGGADPGLMHSVLWSSLRPQARFVPSSPDSLSIFMYPPGTCVPGYRIPPPARLWERRDACCLCGWQGSCRPHWDSLISSGAPGTHVPGYHMPSLRGLDTHLQAAFLSEIQRFCPPLGAGGCGLEVNPRVRLRRSRVRRGGGRRVRRRSRRRAWAAGRCS